jgi:hypothetical protein
LPFTAVASIVQLEIAPAGSATVALLTASGAFAGPKANVVPLYVTVVPSRLAEYPCPVWSNPPEVNVVPSVTIPLRLYTEDRFACGCTGSNTRVTFVECCRATEVPVMVMGYVPGGVVNNVETYNAELPDPLTVAGLNAAVRPLGSPLALSVTVPLNPSIATTALE